MSRNLKISFFIIFLTTAVLVWFFVEHSEKQEPGFGQFPESGDSQDDSIDADAPDRLLEISNDDIEIEHSWKDDSCPHEFDVSINLTGPYLGTWRLDEKSIPDWLELEDVEGNLPYTIDQITFNCNLVNFKDHVETARLNFHAFNLEGQGTSQASLDISLDIAE